MTAQSIETAATEATAPQHGSEITVPLNRLKASPKNARKTPHSPATIEAFAASIKAKGVLQPPVVEIERDGEGAPTGNYLVTIGEGRRQGLRLLAKRKAIKRTHPVRVIVDVRHTVKAAQDEDVAVELRHGSYDLGEQNLIELGRRFGFGGLEVGVAWPTTLMFGVIADQIEGDPEQEGAGMGDPAVGEGRDADIGFLHDVGRVVRTDPGPETTVQPRSVAAVQAVQPAAHLRLQWLRFAHPASPTAIQTAGIRGANGQPGAGAHTPDTVIRSATATPRVGRRRRYRTGDSKPLPTRRSAWRGMNQTESRRKREGSGVGILCERGPLLQRAAPPPSATNPGSGCAPISRRPTAPLLSRPVCGSTGGEASVPQETCGRPAIHRRCPGANPPCTEGVRQPVV